MWLRRMKSLLSQFLLEKRVLIWHETSAFLSFSDRPSLRLEEESGHGRGGYTEEAEEEH